MKQACFCILIFICSLSWVLEAQEPLPSPPPKMAKNPGRLSLTSTGQDSPEEVPFIVPLPAHSTNAPQASSAVGFRVPPGRQSSPSPMEKETATAEYFLPDRDTKPPIAPENANLNLPTDLEFNATDTGEKIVLPAGTYRQILQLPIQSPRMQTTDQIRRDQAQPVEVPKAKSRYAEPEKKPVWVRYESLEKIRIGEAERRGGIDLPSHGPKELGPRVWYAKSETTDVASSVFYFVFGGLGYSTANLLGWSAGNIREIPGDFEYRLIRR